MVFALNSIVSSKDSRLAVVHEYQHLILVEALNGFPALLFRVNHAGSSQAKPVERILRASRGNEASKLVWLAAIVVVHFLANPAPYQFPDADRGIETSRLNSFKTPAAAVSSRTRRATDMAVPPTSSIGAQIAARNTLNVLLQAGAEARFLVERIRGGRGPRYALRALTVSVDLLI